MLVDSAKRFQECLEVLLPDRVTRIKFKTTSTCWTSSSVKPGFVSTLSVLFLLFCVLFSLVTRTYTSRLSDYYYYYYYYRTDIPVGSWHDTYTEACSAVLSAADT